MYRDLTIKCGNVLNCYKLMYLLLKTVYHSVDSRCIQRSAICSLSYVVHITECRPCTTYVGYRKGGCFNSTESWPQWDQFPRKPFRTQPGTGSRSRSQTADRLEAEAGRPLWGQKEDTGCSGKGRQHCGPGGIHLGDRRGVTVRFSREIDPSRYTEVYIWDSL